MELSSQQLSANHAPFIEVDPSVSAEGGSNISPSFDMVKSELFDSMRVFEVLDNKSLPEIRVSGDINDYKETSLELARFRADLYRIETVATAAQNVIGTIKNFIGTFTK